MSTRDSWARVVSAAGNPGAVADRDATVWSAMRLGLGVGPEVVACSVTELAGDGHRTPFWSGAVALDADGAQYGAGAGPCLTAARSGRPQHLAGAAELARFPAFAAAAERLGIASSLSLPLAGTTPPAAMNFYAATPGALGPPRSRAVADLLSRCVAGLLRPAGPAVSPDRVEAALAQRAVVRRAQETVSAQRQLSLPDALRWLIRRSRTEDRSIHRVAEDVGGGAGTEVAS